MKHIVAVLTSYNRKDSTVRCLEKLEVAAQQAAVGLHAILVDDGSTDGTAAAVAGRFPWVSIDHGDGSLFWNRGMHRAMTAALRERFDYLLWLNDDTDLEADALQRMIGIESELAGRTGRPVIVVGATADRGTGRLTYGGIVARSRWRPFTFSKVHSENEALPCDTMNGNAVLMPAAVVHDVGNLDPFFEHASGDIDYGLRARRHGHPIYAAPGFVGRCSSNPVAGTHADTSLPLRVRWRKMLHRKGVPPRSWLRLTRRHGGLLWPVYFLWPYARLLTSALRPAGVARQPGANDA